jgi:WD40 repeat protein
MKLLSCACVADFSDASFWQSKHFLLFADLLAMFQSRARSSSAACVSLLLSPLLLGPVLLGGAASNGVAQDFGNSKVVVWDDGEYVVAPSGGEAVVLTDFCHGGAMVAGGTRKGKVAVFNATTGSNVFSIDLAYSNGEALVGVDVANAGTELLVASSAGAVHVYDLRPSPPTVAVGALPTGVSSVDVQWASSRLVVGFADGAIREYSLPGLTLLAELRSSDDAGSVSFVRYVSGASSVLSAVRGEGVPGFPETGLTLWDVQTASVVDEVDGFSGRVSAYQRGGRLVVGSDALQGGSYDLGSSGRVDAALRDSIAVSVSGATATRVAEVTHSAVRIFAFDPLAGGLEQEAVRAYFGPSDSFLVGGSVSEQIARDVFSCGTSDGAIRVYRITDGSAPAVYEAVVNLDLDLGSTTLQAEAFLHGHSAPVAEIEAAPGSSVWLSRSEAGEVFEWSCSVQAGVWSRTDVPRGALSGAPMRRDDATSFAPDGSRVAIIEPDRRVAIYSVGTYASPLYVIEPQLTVSQVGDRGVGSLVWADASSLVVAGVDGWLARVDVSSGSVLNWLLPVPASADFLGFSRLERISLASGGERVVAIPRYYIGGLSDVWHGTVEIDVSTWSVTRNSLDQDMVAPIAVPWDGGLLVHSGDAMVEPLLRGVGGTADRSFDNPSLELLGATSVGRLGADELLFASEDGLFLVGSVVAAPVDLSVGAPATLSLDGDGPTVMRRGRADGELLIGLHSGRLLLLSEVASGL